MTQSISVQPNEKGTAVVTIAPVDEDDTALGISDLTNPQWQLMKSDGTVINSRSFANCPLSSLTFVLSGDDLAVFGNNDSCRRVLSFQATYDSTAGNGLPLKGECKFSIDRLLGQTDEE